MEKTFNCTLNEEEIKEAITYWLVTKKGYKDKVFPENIRVPVITLIYHGSMQTTKDDPTGFAAKCELEI